METMVATDTVWNPASLYHHGIKGQKWGVRRYQNPDGTYTSEGRARYGLGDGKPYNGPNGRGIIPNGASASVRRKALDSANKANKKDNKVNFKHDSESRKRLEEIAKNTRISDLPAYLSNKMDSIRVAMNGIKMDTPLYRIQAEDSYNPEFAFYATYKKADVDKYTGMFSYNIRNRRAAQAKAEGASKAEIKAKKNMDIHQVKFSQNHKLREVDSATAQNTVAKLMKDKSFLNDLKKSIDHSSQNMRRPGQIRLFNNAKKILNQNKNPNDLTLREKKTLYEALNLSLTFHEDYENRVQDKFYGALKKQGYDTILDLNDKKYSSYHAKSPMIIFNTDSVSVESVTKLDNRQIKKLHDTNVKKIAVQEAVHQITHFVPDAASITINQIDSYYDTKKKKKNK